MLFNTPTGAHTKDTFAQPIPIYGQDRLNTLVARYGIPSTRLDALETIDKKRAYTSLILCNHYAKTWIHLEALLCPTLNEFQQRAKRHSDAALTRALQLALEHFNLALAMDILSHVSESTDCNASTAPTVSANHLCTEAPCELIFAAALNGLDTLLSVSQLFDLPLQLLRCDHLLFTQREDVIQYARQSSSHFFCTLQSPPNTCYVLSLMPHALSSGVLTSIHAVYAWLMAIVAPLPAAATASSAYATIHPLPSCLGIRAATITTWLHHACASGNLEALQALEAMCPQVHTLYPRSYTGALLWAAASGNPDTLKAIKKKTHTNHSPPLWYFALSGCADVHHHAGSHAATEQEIEKTMYIALALGHVALAHAIVQQYPSCRYLLCVAHRACTASQNPCMRTWMLTHGTFFRKRSLLSNAPHVSATSHGFFMPPRTSFLARSNPDFHASLFHDIP